MSLKPNLSVITNIDFDHPEFFIDFKSYKDSFKNFLLQTKDIVLANMSDENVADVVEEVVNETGIDFLDYSKIQLNIDLKVTGDFNLLNAAAASLVGEVLKINKDLIKNSLKNFSGTKRRMELLGKLNHTTLVFSDFAHHPTEIDITLKAFKEKYPGKNIILFFQPHMFSRTKYLFDDFVRVFKKAPIDEGFILDIYPSREKPIKNISSKKLVNEINSPKIKFAKSNDLNKFLKKCSDNNLLIFMGAGDIDQMARRALRA